VCIPSAALLQACSLLGRSLFSQRNLLSFLTYAKACWIVRHTHLGTWDLTHSYYEARACVRAAQRYCRGAPHLESSPRSEGFHKESHCKLCWTWRVITREKTCICLGMSLMTIWESGHYTFYLYSVFIHLVFKDVRHNLAFLSSTGNTFLVFNSPPDHRILFEQAKCFKCF